MPNRYHNLEQVPVSLLVADIANHAAWVGKVFVIDYGPDGVNYYRAATPEETRQHLLVLRAEIDAALETPGVSSYPCGLCEGPNYTGELCPTCAERYYRPGESCFTKDDPDENDCAPRGDETF